MGSLTTVHWRSSIIHVRRAAPASLSASYRRPNRTVPYRTSIRLGQSGGGGGGVRAVPCNPAPKQR
eukprot:358424-Chlamydomonas_euryale.AAC.2